MLSFECAKCGEKELIEPIQEIVDNLEELTVRCITCGHEGKPTFFISKCEPMKWAE